MALSRGDGKEVGGFDIEVAMTRLWQRRWDLGVGGHGCRRTGWVVQLVHGWVTWLGHGGPLGNGWVVRLVWFALFSLLCLCFSGKLR